MSFKDNVLEQATVASYTNFLLFGKNWRNTEEQSIRDKRIEEAYDKVKAILKERCDKKLDTEISQSMDSLLRQTIEVYSETALAAGITFMEEVHAKKKEDKLLYQEMYHSLFYDVGSVLNILQEQEENSKDIAISILKAAQRRTEELFINKSE